MRPLKLQNQLSRKFGSANAEDESDLESNDGGVRLSFHGRRSLYFAPCATCCSSIFRTYLAQQVLMVLSISRGDLAVTSGPMDSRGECPAHHAVDSSALGGRADRGGAGGPASAHARATAGPRDVLRRRGEDESPAVLGGENVHCGLTEECPLF